jgi:hypothetical protein
MRASSRAAALALVLIACSAGHAAAQDEKPRIGPFAVDVRASFPFFPNDQQLADSRGLTLEELPGRGIGVDLGAHVYFLRWKAVTFGIGGQVTLARASSDAQPELGRVGATERLVTGGPHLSFNFGSGDGWSYISGGVGASQWSLIPDGEEAEPGDVEQLFTINYGGGARWFAKPHLAFTFDVRFHAIDPGTPANGRPGSPRTTLLVMSAGISVK